MLFSPDGTVREWVGPPSLVHGESKCAWLLSLVTGGPRNITENSCGYTRLLPVSEEPILIAYSDFKHVGLDGRAHKAILVRKIQVSRHKKSANHSLRVLLSPAA